MYNPENIPQSKFFQVEGGAGKRGGGAPSGEYHHCTLSPKTLRAGGAENGMKYDFC